ncbi:MAG TPA: ABC transporter ATP-binding protein [Dongiaceae bacterium]|jgi:spermidine/putrescine ABC transporter ATP-binding subunit|nr:ABC transporter ATP-binding protein [Dongiaceae bacterium]
MALLEIDNIQKRIGPLTVVQQFDLNVEKGEFVSFLGPSGCGKTTTLRMIAGFERPSAGVIRIDGRDVTSLRPNQRNVGMVFQSYALFPNMSVADNVAFGLKIAKWPKAEIGPRVEEMLKLIKLPELGERYPYQLSGGQQQRVALARALAVKPQVLLLDEPLSALDAKIRISLREEIRSLQKKLGITTIYVTHDQGEALTMSDRIAVMSQGIVQQVADSLEIYNRPATAFVATFVGETNMFRGKIVAMQGGQAAIDTPSGRLVGLNPQGLRLGSEALLFVRPERMAIVAGAQPAENALDAHLSHIDFEGSFCNIFLRNGEERPIVVHTTPDGHGFSLESGSRAMVAFAPSHATILPVGPTARD